MASSNARVSLAAAGVLVSGVVSLASAPQNRATVYVAVSDNRGRPVGGLTAADFQVLIDDRRQDVLAVAPATDPAAVVLLTDRLGTVDSYSHIDVQRGLSGFVNGIRRAIPGSLFALTTFDGPVVRVSSFAIPPPELDRLIGRLTTVSPDAALLDALADACRTVSAADSRRRIVFLVYGSYRPDTSTITPDMVAPALQASGASLWAIEARVPRQASPGQANREIMVDRGSAISGGRRDIVSSAIGIETMAKQIATLIASQYLLTYGPDSGSVNSIRKIAVARPDVRVHAPSWIAR